MNIVHEVVCITKSPADWQGFAVLTELHLSRAEVLHPERIEIGHAYPMAEALKNA